MTITTISSGTTTVSTLVLPPDGFLVEGSGTLEIVNGGTIVGPVTISSGGNTNVRSGGLLYAPVVSSAGTETIFFGGSAGSGAVSGGGILNVSSGGTDISTTLLADSSGFGQEN